MAEESPLPSGDGVEEEVEPMPGEEGSPFDMAAYDKKLEEMAYRIEEMEKKIAKMEAMMPAPDEKVAEEVEEQMSEEELPKLDGAPIDEALKFSVETNKKNFGKKVVNSQSSFLSKLYK